jgi:hypothetical protein
MTPEQKALKTAHAVHRAVSTVTKQLEQIVAAGSGAMDSEERSVVLIALYLDVGLGGRRPDLEWRLAAAYAGCQHEPETRRA